METSRGSVTGSTGVMGNNNPARQLPASGFAVFSTADRLMNISQRGYFVSRGAAVLQSVVRRGRRWGLGALALSGAFVLPVGASGQNSPAEPKGSVLWSSVFKLIGHNWPSVQQLSTADLALRLEANEPVLLIDTRAKKEYLISHLPGAVWAESPEQLRDAVLNVPATQLIVLYCSVGVRSSKAADLLLKEGGHTVANLRGSIFQWANEGRALEANGQPTKVVHPYNRFFGRMLEPRLRASGAP